MLGTGNLRLYLQPHSLLCHKKTLVEKFAKHICNGNYLRTGGNLQFRKTSGCKVDNDSEKGESENKESSLGGSCSPQSETLY